MHSEPATMPAQSIAFAARRARRATQLHFRQLNLSTTDGMLQGTLEQCLRGRGSFVQPIGTLDLSFCSRLSEAGVLQAVRTLGPGLTNLGLRYCTC